MLIWNPEPFYPARIRSCPCFPHKHFRRLPLYQSSNIRKSTIFEKIFKRTKINYLWKNLQTYDIHYLCKKIYKHTKIHYLCKKSSNIRSSTIFEKIFKHTKIHYLWKNLQTYKDPLSLKKSSNIQSSTNFEKIFKHTKIH